MNIVTKQISELKPYKNNPKIHTDSQIDKIAKSIELTKGIKTTEVKKQIKQQT